MDLIVAPTAPNGLTLQPHLFRSYISSILRAYLIFIKREPYSCLGNDRTALCGSMCSQTGFERMYARLPLCQRDARRICWIKGSFSRDFAIRTLLVLYCHNQGGPRAEDPLKGGRYLSLRRAHDFLVLSFQHRKR